MRCKKAVQSLPDKLEYRVYEIRLGKTALKADIRGVCIHCNSRLMRLSSDIKNEKFKEFYQQKTPKKPKAKVTNKPVQLSLLCN